MARAKILNAGAGSGKTYRLTYKYILDVLGSENSRHEFDVSAYRHIVAVTFTNKATEEMKSRILRQIHILASGGRSDYMSSLERDTGKSEAELRDRARRVRTAILHDYSRFTVLTTDTFFQRIMRAFIKELGIELNYTLELDTAPILSKSADAVISDIATNNETRNWIMGMAQDRIENGSRWNIRDGILLLHNELFKESSRNAISGGIDKEKLKNTVINYSKEADNVIKEFCATAQKVVDIIAQKGLTRQDFKNNTIDWIYKIADGIISEPCDTTKNLVGAPPEAWFRKKPTPTAPMLDAAKTIQPVFEGLCERRTEVVELINSKQFLLKNYRSFAILSDLYNKSLEICCEENTMLLSETGNIISQFITESDTPFIYEKVGNRFDRYMIDEFQDTSLGEWQNFLPLLQNAMAQSSNISVLLVGDIKQMIYRWRGSDWNILGSLAAEQLGKKETEIETLGNNFRSLPKVVEFNNMLFDSIANRGNDDLNKMLTTAHNAGKISDSAYNQVHDALARAYASHTQTPCRPHKNEGYVNISTCPKEPDIASCVKSIIDHGYRPCDITILVRDTKHMKGIVRQLLAVKEEGNPRYRFDIMTQEALRLGSSPAVRFVIAVMRLAVNRKDSISLAIYNRYQKECDFMAGLTDEERTTLDAIRVMSPEEAFEHIVMAYAPEKEGQTAYIQALHEIIVKFCTNRVADIALFLKWWDEKGADESVSVERSESAIEIMTIHKAKGLENKVVIIPYCNWSFKPKSDSGVKKNTIWAKPAGIEGLDIFPVSFNKNIEFSVFAEGFYTETVYSYIDAINILYVALTRAAEQLYIFIPPHQNSSNVGQLICNALPKEKVIIDESGTMRYESGINQPPESHTGKADDSVQVRMSDYCTSPVDMRLRLPSARYFDDGEQIRLTPRNIGITLHKVFEEAATRDDITTRIEQMVIDGTLSKEEALAISEQVRRTLAETVAGEWFDSDWTIVRRENNIITPNGGILRPDRVMIRGKRAVIVDYKFGAESAKHGKQVADYADLLRKMGYEEISGYVWYVKSGNIAQIV